MVRAAFVALAARFGTPTAPARPDDARARRGVRAVGDAAGPRLPAQTRELRPRHAAACAVHVAPADVRAARGGVAAGARGLGARARADATARAFDCPQASGGATGAASGALAIVYPADGARFLLDPERPAALQRPPLRAMPVGGAVRWTIDGVPVDRWLPAPAATWSRPRQ